MNLANSSISQRYSRRQFGKLAIAAGPAAGLLFGRDSTAAAAESSTKNRANLGGVQVGAIAPYSFRGLGNDPEDLLKAIVQLNLGAVELQSQAIEPWAGAPAGGFGRPRGGGRGRREQRGARPLTFNLRGLTETQQAAVREFGEALGEPYQALAQARAALNAASFEEASSSDLKTRADAVTTAELRLAQARADAFSELQASSGKLDDRQIEMLVQQSAEGGARDDGQRGRGRGGRGGGNPAFEAMMRERTKEIRNWRLSQSMDKFKQLGKMYSDAGVRIGLVKFGLGSSMTDDEVDYCFQVAKAVGANGITCEPPVSETRRLGQFAEKHKLMIGYHGHSNVSSPESFGRPGAWEQAFFYSKWNGANIDIGHFAAGNSVPATEFIKRYHHRITNLHLKDRKFEQGPNMPWGQGDSQVKEILQLMKREKYPFMATIELEYRIPEGSDAMTELAKCVQFCKDALA